MNVKHDSIIAVVDDKMQHEWVTDPLPIPCISAVGFLMDANFIKTVNGRLEFAANLLYKRKMLQAQYEGTGLCVCHLETGFEHNVVDGTERFVFLITIYSLRKAKLYLQHLVKCQLARRATECALRHQGLVHRDAIPLIGQCVWETRREIEWVTK